MSQDRLLICSVTAHDGAMVCACRHCGWLSAPVATGGECGSAWDEHVAQAHAGVRQTSNA